MYGKIEHIGVISKNDLVHSITLKDGINIITGKSSTGKSAIIEIFDYCFGSTLSTIPIGIITQNAEIFFVVMTVGKNILVLGRRPDEKKILFKTVTDFVPIEKINIEYFNDFPQVPLKEFRILLGQYFGLSLSDIDEQYTYRSENGLKKKPRPSVRHFMSFMLQHQNLIANKHSLFFRFDDYEKREQTIDCFPYFAGFVDENYYSTLRELSKVLTNLDKLEATATQINQNKQQTEEKLNELLKQYEIASGYRLTDKDGHYLLLDPEHTLEKLSNYEVKLDTSSQNFLVKRQELKKQQSFLEAKRREYSIEYDKINSSVKYANNFNKNFDNLKTIQNSVFVTETECPFCKNKNVNTIDEANNLVQAINWLNSELGKTPYLIDSLTLELDKAKEKVEEVYHELSKTNEEIQEIDDINKKFSKYKDADEVLRKIKERIETILEDNDETDINSISKEIQELKNKKTTIERKINTDYNIEDKISFAERFINEEMNKFGTKLNFETTFQPINLRFSLKKFELWHESKEHGKIYLRAMGSGANWLNCHIVLFTSLLKYFCKLGDKSKLPPILFIDQPSQVYFPSTVDVNDKFDHKKLKELAKQDEKKADEDLDAVINLYSNLISFCDETKNETLIKPQIIITDHADGLELRNYNFDEYVRARWRTRGFIDEELENEIKKTDVDNTI